MLKSFFYVIGLVCANAICFGQHTVSGLVLDNQTNEPLPGASVWIANDVGRITDDVGRFSIPGVATGVYTIKVSYVGYTDYSAEVTVPQTSSLTIHLVATAIVKDAVIVTATRAGANTPATFSTVSKENIRKQNFGQDVPYLLNFTPSVVTTSDAGTGFGYTGIRIRGSDPTRINVTINGVPYNDSESLGTFWVDVPDIASSTENIQVQRGVGTSTNGAGAFGATINLQTNSVSEKPYADIVNAMGSFNTRRHTLGFGSGLISKNWVVEGRVSKISSDGFIDRATADLQSHYFSAAFVSQKTIVKGIVFGGHERTYQAWYGVPESRLNNDVEAMEMTAVNEGWNDIQTNNLLMSNSRTFNPYLYENEVDDYRQDHHQLHLTQTLTDELVLNTSLHYTKGRGFYEQYRFDDDFEDYSLTPPVINGVEVTSSDIIRRRWLDNDFYGTTFSLKFDSQTTGAILGGGLNRYDGDHFGEIIWAEVTDVPPGFEYYRNNGDKRDFNIFLKVNQDLMPGLNVFADMQLRRVAYEASGIDNDQINFNIDVDYNFFNPKVGVNYAMSDRGQLYVFGGMGHREPVREDFIGSANTPRHERLVNFELGYKHRSARSTFTINYYLMNYTDQLVLTGDLNDVGAPIRTNAGKSYRAGIELDGSVVLSNNFRWAANLSLSRNKIDRYIEVLEDYGENFDEFSIVKNEYRNTDIAFSPAVVASSQLSFVRVKNTELTLLSKYVGKQYLDNSQNDARAIEGYFVNDLRVSYTWKPTFAREISLSALINNVLDVEYESNGYTWGYLAGSTAYRENYYYPQAGRNFLLMLSIRL